MRRLWLSAVALLSVAVLGVAVAGAESSWTDPSGDALGSAPDITGLQVSNDNGGQILFSVAVSNLTPESGLYLFLDTDKNAATGDDGQEYVLSWDASSDPDYNGWYIEHWSGTSWVHPDHPTMRAMLTTTGVDFSVNRTDLGNTSGFAVKLFAPRWTADAITGMDTAPDGLAAWTYDLTVAPTPAPVVAPIFGSVTTVPARPVAGKKFVFTLAVKRSDTGAPLTQGTMVCDPSVGGKVIKHAESFTGGKARLAFVVPKTARGKQLKVKVKIVTGTQSATKVATFKVK
jgi:hypothetical protein